MDNLFLYNYRSASWVRPMYPKTRLTSNRLPAKYARRSESTAKILVVTETTAISFWRWRPKMPTLPMPCSSRKMRLIWVLETRVSCLVMLLTNGTRKLCIHTLTTWLARLWKRWPFSVTQRPSHGSAPTANPKLSWNM